MEGETCRTRRRLIPDRAFDADHFRQTLRAAGTTPVIPGRRNRTVQIRHDRQRYRDRWRIEATIGRLKDFRRVATRYDKLARPSSTPSPLPPSTPCKKQAIKHFLICFEYQCSLLQAEQVNAFTKTKCSYASFIDY